MEPPSTAHTYVVGVGREIEQFAHAHRAQAGAWLKALCALACVAVFASYLAWAWRDIDHACAASGSEHCTRPIVDPTMRAERDVMCSARAAGCSQFFVGLAVRTVVDDALRAVGDMSRYTWGHLQYTFLLVFAVVFLIAIVQKVLMWFEYPVYSVMSLIQAVFPSSNSPRPPTSTKDE